MSLDSEDWHVETTHANVLLAMPDAIDQAARLLRRGGLVAFATETVYGLGADASSDAAVARIYEAKGRPRFNPLIIHVANFAQAEKYGIFNADGVKLAHAFWPGPLTLVTERRENAGLSSLATAGLPTVALRMPAHDTAQRLLMAAQRPLAAPSANRSGRVSATTAKHVAADFGASVDLILDSGPCTTGLESTIIGLGDGAPRLMRPGAIPREAIEAICGPLSAAEQSATPQSPGQLRSHYAPRARLRLNIAEADPGEPHLTFGPNGPRGRHALNLSASGNLVEAAANLFAFLRRLDALGPHSIAVMPIPLHGLGEAINDRLRRAAAPRDA